MFMRFFLLTCILLFSSAQMIIDHVKFLRPADFDVLLSDINEGDLRLIAQLDEAAYLNISSTVDPLFPVEGVVMGSRYMINLLVRRRNQHAYRNVVFMIDTGSPYTFLSKTAIEALLESDTVNVPSMLKLEIHGKQSLICYMSPVDKHFADINLLGMDFLESKGALIETDWAAKTFLLYDANSR